MLMQKSRHSAASDPIVAGVETVYQNRQRASCIIFMLSSTLSYRYLRSLFSKAYLRLPTVAK